MQKWSSLHSHMGGISLDGVGTLSRLINRAHEMKFKHFGLTDHGNLGGLVQLAYECNKRNIKPIMGLEIYTCIGADRKKTFHLTLLADGEKGFSTLVKLNNIAVRSEINARRPVMNIFELLQHNDGIVLLSGCPSSPLHGLDYDDAKDVYAKLINAMGKDRVWAEIMPHSTPFLQHEAWQRTIKFAKDFGLRVITTNDVHFPFKEDKAVQKIIMQLRSGWDYEADGLFLRSDKQMLGAAADVGGNELVRAINIGMNNSLWLADKLESKIFSGTPILPEIEDADNKLYKLASEGLAKLGLDCNPEAAQRLEYELNIITQKGFSGYTLIVNEIADVARQKEIPMGYGRGSAAGSLVSYCLGITKTNPLKYDLQFERYLNPLRDSPVDIDIDFGSRGRENILDYMSKKYNAVGVAAYSTYSHSAAVRALGRYFNVNVELIAELSENHDDLDNDPGHTICNAYPMFRIAYETILGSISHTSRHAGGVAIGNEDVEVPLMRLRKNVYVSALSEAGNHDDLSKFGLYKFDILAVSTLDAIHELREKHKNIVPNPEDDTKPLELLKNGDTLGIFQLDGSDFKREYIKKLDVSDFETVIDLNALWRTSVLMSGGADNYVETRVFSGQPFLRRNIDSSCNKVEIDEKFVVYDDDEIMLIDGSFKTVKDLTEKDKIKLKE